MANYKVKYSVELKIQAGEMFESGMTGEQIAEKLGVPKWVALYLQYEGRKLKGVLPNKREFKPREKGRHPHKDYVFQPTPKQFISKVGVRNISPNKEIDAFQVQDFVENNVSPVPTNAKFTGFTVLLIISMVLLYALYF
jgi:hypothetical protein